MHVGAALAIAVAIIVRACAVPPFPPSIIAGARREEAAKIRESFPSRVGVICTKGACVRAACVAGGRADRVESHRRGATGTLTRVATPPRSPACTAARSARSDVPAIDRSKFLVPEDLTLGQFQWVIRRRLQLPPVSGLPVGVAPPAASAARHFGRRPQLPSPLTRLPRYLTARPHGAAGEGAVPVPHGQRRPQERAGALVGAAEGAARGSRRRGRLPVRVLLQREHVRIMRMGAGCPTLVVTGRERDGRHDAAQCLNATY